MVIEFDFLAINWLSVIVAAVLAFAIGGLWYSPILVGNRWQKEAGLSDERLKSSNMGLIFGTTFLLNLISAILLELILGKESSLSVGFFVALELSLGFISTALAINYLFTRKSVVLFLIDAGYFVIFYCVMGAILGAW